MSLIPIAAGIVLGLLAVQGHAQQCESAETAVEVLASVSGSDALTVSYAVVNRTRFALVWMSIGNGGPDRTPLVPQQTPVVERAPSGWTGTVVYPEETPYVHLWWEARDVGAALQPGTTMRGFVVRVAAPTTVPPGLRGTDGRPVRPIDFGTLPFTVGGTGARCWWGRVKSVAGPQGRGDWPGVGIASMVRPAADPRR